MNDLDDFLEELTDEVLDIACGRIQERLNVDDGGFAGMYWSGSKGKEIRELLRAYYLAEQANQ